MQQTKVAGNFERLCWMCKFQFDYSNEKPKLFECNHFFCMDCAVFLKETTICPLCNKTPCVQRNGLPDNVLVLPQIEPLSSSLNPQLRTTSPLSTVQDEQNTEGACSDDIFISDDDIDENFNVKNNDVSNDEDSDEGSPKILNLENRLFCNTCLALPTILCPISSHEIVDYISAVKSLQKRLEVAVGGAKETLRQEVEFLERHSALMCQIQTSWSSVGEHIDISYSSLTKSLSTANSLLQNTLPNLTLSAIKWTEKEDSTSVAQAISTTENILEQTLSRNVVHKTEIPVWESLPNCTVKVQANNSIANFQLELIGQNNEESECMVHVLSNLCVVDKIRNQVTQPVTKEKKEEAKEKEAEKEKQRLSKPQLKPEKNDFKQKSSLIPKYNVKNAKPAPFTNIAKKSGSNTNEWVLIPGKNSAKKNIASPINSGCVHCYFDLFQNKVKKGRIVMEINCNAAPKMAQNFIDLCTGKHGYSYSHTKLRKNSSGDYVDGRAKPKRGEWLTDNMNTFLADASTLQDDVGMLRMRGSATSQDGQPIISSEFMIWTERRDFRNYTKTLVFGVLKTGIEILRAMPKFIPKPDLPYVPPVIIVECGILE